MDGPVADVGAPAGASGTTMLEEDAAEEEEEEEERGGRGLMSSRQYPPAPKARNPTRTHPRKADANHNDHTNIANR